MEWYSHRRPVWDLLVDAVAPYISTESVIIDVGANIGYFSLCLTEKLGRVKTLYLFEPVPHLADLCKKTFATSAVETHVYAIGLSDEESTTDIYVGADGNLGWNTIVAEKASPNMIKVPIALKVFDRCGIDAVPGFIKIDVEGVEYKVLRGMRESLARWHPLPVILCELSWGSSHPHWHEVVQVIQELKTIGYVVNDLEGNPIDEHDIRTTCDVIFVPSDRV
jgi:FkbM family methyltransferase